MRLRLVLVVLSLALFVTSGLMSLTVAASQQLHYNIIYLHVPAAITALLCFTALFVCSVQFLRTTKRIWDHTAAAAAQVGLVFAIVLNITGSIFARATWGVWWTPSLRLISSAMLGFLYLAYQILRVSFPPPRRGRICAVFGIIAFADVPLVYISSRFVPDIHWPSFTFETVYQSLTFALAVFATFLLAIVLIWLRVDLAELQARLDKLT